MKRKNLKRNPADYRFFEDGSASFIEAYRHLCQGARLKYTTILDIVTFSEGVSSNKERLAKAGYGHFQEIQWLVSEADNDYGTGEEHTGGGVVFAKDGTGRFGALVCISECSEMMRSSPVETQHAAHQVPVLCHELGHVDDFEKRINLVPTKRLDITAIELYAHRYACKMMVRHNLRISLKFYLDALVPSMLRHGGPAEQKAAKTFLESSERMEFHRFVGKT